MDWKDLERSNNVEDQRGSSGASKVAIGGGASLIVVIIAALFGVNPNEIMKILGNDTETTSTSPSTNNSGTSSTGSTAAAPADDIDRDFVAAILGDTEVVWNKLFKDNDLPYNDPKLVLFSGSVESACGSASASMGPFYCSGDQKVYLDLSFFKDMREELNAPGDFARAYVIAHEVGHHIQNELGIFEQVAKASQGLSKKEVNAISVRQELQADCFAGVWANTTKKRQLIDQADIASALGAAHAVGDDTLQQAGSGQVVPDSFTHGSSEQRIRWFKAGLATGDPGKCDTFNAEKL